MQKQCIAAYLSFNTLMSLGLIDININLLAKVILMFFRH